ncbi:glycosyltransferase [Campylobacterota bacterium DY0563]
MDKNKKLFIKNEDMINGILYHNLISNEYVKFFALLLKVKYSNESFCVMGDTILAKLIKLFAPNIICLTQIQLSKKWIEKINCIITLNNNDYQFVCENSSLKNKQVFNFSVLFEEKLGKRISHIDMINFEPNSLIEIERIFYILLDVYLNNKKIALYGAGTIAKVIHLLFSDKIVFFADINYKNINQINQNIPIINPEKIKKYSFDTMIISPLGREKRIMKYLDLQKISKEKMNVLVDNISEEEVLNIVKVFTQLLQLVQDDELYYLSKKDYENIENLGEYSFGISQKPEISIVIPVYNQFEFTYMTLKSIYDNIEKNLNVEIILVNDCSTDNRVKYIDKYFKNISILNNEKNLGFLRSCNYAVSKANGKYIVLLNNDVLVQKNWLDSLYQTITTDKSIGLVGSKFLFLDGSVQEAGGIVFSDGTATHYGRGGAFWNSFDTSYTKEVDYVSAASIMISKKLWEDVGGFDELYAPAYCEDVDLAFKVRKFGYKVVLQPQSTLIHFEGMSHGNNIEKGLKKYQLVNQKKFFNKWKDILLTQSSSKESNFFLSRDRSMKKEHIVIFDNLIPTFDQDAGSRNIWQYMNILKRLNYHISFVPYNFNSNKKYINKIQKSGIEVLYPDSTVTTIENWHQCIFKWLENNGQYLDYCFILRPHVAEVFFPICKEKTAAKIIFHVVDIHHLRMQREEGKDFSKEIIAMKELEFCLLKSFDYITVVSQFEKEYINNNIIKSNIQVLPIFLYSSEFPLSRNAYEERKDIMFIGGFNHNPNLDGILWFVKKIFPDILKEQPSINFYIVGSNPSPEILSLSSKNITVLGYVSDEDLTKIYNKVLVCVAPLRYGAGVKGKVIESIANGVPIVTTDIGAEGIIDIDCNPEILSIASESSFAKEVSKLLKSKKLWDKMRQKQIEYSKIYLDEKYAEKSLKRLFSK